MESPESVITPVVDQKERLTPADVRLMKIRMIRHLRNWSVFALAGSVALMIWAEPSDGFFLKVFFFWLIVGGWIFYRNNRMIDRGEKLITRGVVSARWGRDDEAGRNKKMATTFVLVVHGKQVVVDAATYKKYFKRDIAEFHYLADGFILHHQLLKRAQ